MPFRCAASERGLPSSTMASARTRRTCAPSVHLDEAARSSDAPRSFRVTRTAVPISALPCCESPPSSIESQFSADGNRPESHTYRGLVSDCECPFKSILLGQASGIEATNSPRPSRSRRWLASLSLQQISPACARRAAIARPMPIEEPVTSNGGPAITLSPPPQQDGRTRCRTCRAYPLTRAHCARPASGLAFLARLPGH